MLLNTKIIQDVYKYFYQHNFFKKKTSQSIKLCLQVWRGRDEKFQKEKKKKAEEIKNFRMWGV